MNSSVLQRKIKILSIMPESIAGRLIITGLSLAFEKLGCELVYVDKLESDAKEQVKSMDIKSFDYMFSYDFVAVEFKEDLNLDIKTINYFSDVIQSPTSGAYWVKYYSKLKDDSNYVFYWDEELVKQAGDEIAKLYYLPHAVDVEVYKNLNLPAEYDVMFAGRLTYGIRVERFLRLLKALPNVKFALYCFPKHLEQVCEKVDKNDAELLKSVYKGFIDTEEKMSEAINKSKIVINYTSQGGSSLNYRLFQVLACEKFLLTDYRKELDTLFKPGEDIEFYTDEDDLILKIKEYLKNPQNYKKMLENGRKTILEKFTCEKACEFMLKNI